MTMAFLSPLADFRTHDLTDQLKATLMNRVDTKFLVPPRVLEVCLSGLQKAYTVLDMEGNLRPGYDTLYFDTPERKLYLDHHNGKLNRLKVRLRHYRQSRTTFLEVKKKTNRQRTVKTRMPVASAWFADTGVAAFLSEQSGLPAARMQPALFVSYQRTTLISPDGAERITMDTQLAFHSPDRARSVALPELAVVELKVDRKAGNSPMRQRLGQLGYRNVAMSKYCLGTSLLFGSELKINRFKPLLRSLYGSCS